MMLAMITISAISRFPIMMLCGIIPFLLIRGCLRCKYHTVQTIMMILSAVALLLSVAGMVYGVLRFSGSLLFSYDNTNSYNWFDATWRDDGFRWFCICIPAFAGIIAALRQKIHLPERT